MVAAHDTVPTGLLRIEDCLDADGGIVVPPGTTLISLIERNIASVGDSIAYRYLDHSGSGEPHAVELSWAELGVRLRAIGARIQAVAGRGDRVAILAPQGLEFVAGFFAAIKAGTIAVPLFAPELPGHAERLEIALRDARPSVVLTTAAVREVVEAFLGSHGVGSPAGAPQVIVIDEVPDEAGDAFAATELDMDDVSHLQYTGGSTRPPVGVEITHRAVGFNLLQMILSIDMLDRNTHGVSWLPLYHDMGLSMIGFPTVYGGHSTLMSPTAFIRRPRRWIDALAAGSRDARVVTAAPNFAYEWTAQRGVPEPGADIDLSRVVMIIGSEPVSAGAIASFNDAFAPFGLPPTAIKPSYGIAEATLLVSTTDTPSAHTVTYVDRAELSAGRVAPVSSDAPDRLAQVSCGRVARSEWAVIVDPETAAELPDGRVGEIWLQGDNIGRGYWGRPEDTRRTFGARLHSVLDADSHSAGAVPGGNWLRTGDLGFYHRDELYVTGRLADLLVIGGRAHYPQDIEGTVADAASLVRRGYVVAYAADGAEAVTILAERAAGTARADVQAAVEAIRELVTRRHGVAVADVRVLPAGAIPRTTSGKLARWACRAEARHRRPAIR
ncbi:MAG: fatty acyl-AMP ligase [Mycobacterium sp.]